MKQPIILSAILLLSSSIHNISAATPPASLTDAIAQGITSVEVRGTVADGAIALQPTGNNIWTGTVNLTQPGSNEYPGRYIYFTLNNDDSMVLKRTPASNIIGLASNGSATENIRINPGTYVITLNLNTQTFNIDADVDAYRVSVFGSSVANGEGAENRQGYAYNYGELLKSRYNNSLSKYPLYTAGVSIGGNTTVALLNRYDDVLRDFSRFVIIGLSMGNEGIHGAANPEQVFNQFSNNMQTLIAQLRADGKIPVVVNNYTRADFTPSDYRYVKQMNLLIHQWDVPSINSLGAIDNGAGQWADNFISDPYHPNTAGHMEFAYAFVPSLFDALCEGKPQPTRDTTQSATITNGNFIEFTPDATVHPFTIAARIAGNEAGRIFDFSTSTCSNFTGFVAVNANGTVTYHTPTGSTVTTQSTPLADNRWHDVVLTHYYAWGRTFLYIDGLLMGTVSEQLAPTTLRFGDTTSHNTTRKFSEISFWRSGMNDEELMAHHHGAMLQSSLELYSPIAPTTGNTVIPNRAQSLNSAVWMEKAH
jgi:lysophospholipase L1-like esterase